MCMSLDSHNQRVVKFDTVGNYLGQIGSTGVLGSDSSHFAYPQGLTVDSAHKLYVADDQNDRIQKFDSSGIYLATIGSSAQMNNPYDVGVDGVGNVYVADNLNHRIDKFSPAGTFVKSWGGKGTSAGKLQTPRAIAVDGAGNNYVADTNNERMQEFDANGNLVGASGSNPWGLNGRDGGRLSGPEELDAPTGKLVIADTLEYWIQELNPSDGSLLTKFGGHGTGPGQFELPGDVAVDGAGRTDVADTNNDRIQQFDSSNRYIGEAGGLGGPAGVAADVSGDFFVADTNNNRVQEFNPSRALKRTWSIFAGSDSFSQPGDATVSPGGELYVADTDHDRVVAFDSAGNFVRTWPVSGTSPSRPSGIEVHGQGNVWVADPGNAIVHQYAPTGAELLRFGQRGHGSGEFWTGGPNDVTLDADGNVYVSDTYNNRVERFSFTARPLAPTVTTGVANSVTDTSAIITGTLDPNGRATTYHFQYGTTTAYGSNAPAADADAGSGTTAQPVSANLTTLTAATTYHYRLVGTNATGTSYGTTRRSPPPPRRHLRRHPPPSSRLNRQAGSPRPARHSTGRSIPGA